MSRAEPAPSRAAVAMPVRFRNITETQIDPTRVTLRIFMGTDGIVLGRVSTLAYGAGTYGAGEVELMSTEGADPPIATALELAEKLAAFKEQDVDVVDPASLWQADWGQIEER